MTDYTELKRLADAAKNWGGEVGEERWYTAECFKQPYFSVPDAEFIAVCDPGSIRALIAENERLETERADLWRGKRDVEAARDTKSAVIAELKAEIAGLKTGYEAYERVNAELKAENEALRKIISESATACGAAVSVECSLEFMAMLPEEIGSVLAALRKERDARHPFKPVHEPSIGFTGCVICGVYTDHGGLPCPTKRAAADASMGKGEQQEGGLQTDHKSSESIDTEGAKGGLQ